MRVPVLQREKTAILYMRKHFSYTTQALAQAFHRSLSLIHRILKWNSALGTLTFLDQRHLPSFTKKNAGPRMRRQLAFWMEKWMPFISGLEEEPP